MPTAKVQMMPVSWICVLVTKEAGLVWPASKALTAVWDNKLVLHWTWRRKRWWFRASAESLPGFPQKFILANVPKPPLLLLCPCWILQGSTKMLAFAAKVSLLCKHIPNVSQDVWLLELGFLWVGKASKGSSCVLCHIEGNGRRQKAISQVRMCAEHFYYCYLFYGHARSAALWRRQSEPLAQLV